MIEAKPVAFREVRRRLRADRERLHSILSAHSAQDRRPSFLHPSYACVILYRWSNYFAQRRRRLIARFLWHLNILLTGADISELAQVGEGLVILNPPGTAISGVAGRNLTLMPCSGLGSEVGRFDDIGGGPGQPVVGDDVLIEAHAGIMGPVRVGSRVHVAAGIGVTQDVPDDTFVEGPRPRFVKRRDLA